MEYRRREAWICGPKIASEEGQVGTNERPGGIVRKCVGDSGEVGFGRGGEYGQYQGRLGVEGLND